MQNFQLYILKLNPLSPSNPSLIPIGSSTSTTYSTYNEKLTIKSNNQYSFTFNIPLYLLNKRNPSVDHIIPGQRLRLIQNDDKVNFIDFIITKITPTISQQNTTYQVTAQDWCSYDLTHTAQGLTFSTTRPLNISQLANAIITESNAYRWAVDNNLENGITPDFVQTLDTTGLNTMTVSFDISNSNCYNALVQAGNLFNGGLTIKYNWSGIGGIISYVNLQTASHHQYYLNPSISINNFSMSQSSNDLSTLLYVSGGENAQGELVSLTPPIHEAFAYWLSEHTPHTVQDFNHLPSYNEHPYYFLDAYNPNITDATDYTYRRYKTNISQEILQDEIFYDVHKEYSNNARATFYLRIYCQTETLSYSLYLYDGNSIKQIDHLMTSKVEFDLDLNYRRIVFSFDAHDLLIPDETKFWLYAVVNGVYYGLGCTFTGDLDTTPIIERINCQQEYGIQFKSAQWEHTSWLSTDLVWTEQVDFNRVYNMFITEWNIAINSQSNKTKESTESSTEESTEKNIVIDLGLKGYGSVYNQSVRNNIADFCNFIQNYNKSASNFLYDFSYLIENEIMTIPERNELESMLNFDLRNSNLQLLLVTPRYYQQQYQFNQSMGTINTYLAAIASTFEEERQIRADIKTNQRESTMTDYVYSLMFGDTEASVLNDILEYTDTDTRLRDCYANRKLQISNLIKDGLNASFIRNAFDLYGQNFFTNVSYENHRNDVNASYFKIFQNQTGQFLSEIQAYYNILGIYNDTGLYDLTYSNDKSSISPSVYLDANTHLAKAQEIINYSDLYFDDNGRYYLGSGNATSYHSKPSMLTLWNKIVSAFILTPNSLYNDIYNSYQSSEFTIRNRYEQLTKQRDDIWSNINRKYGHYIWSSQYNDSVQLDYKGLYNSAIIAFEKLRTPQYTYNTTIINADDLLSWSYKNIGIGDDVIIQHPIAFSKRAKNKLTIHRSKENKMSSSVVLNSEIQCVEYESNLVSSASNYLTGEIEYSKGSEYTVKFVDNLNTPQIYNITTQFTGGPFTFITDIPHNIKVVNSDVSDESIYIKIDPEIRGGVHQAILCYKTQDKTIYTPLNIYIVTVQSNEYDDDELNRLADFSSERLYIIWLNNTTFKWASINADRKVTELTAEPIMAESVYESEPIRLKITGLTKDLRASSVQITVQDNNIVNNLVDKLLYSVRSS